ncbi:MAG TPA: 2-C-methyl-D-erythritol 4-phosphate cytidylyltransferase [Nitrospiria bacterium]|nr:2-C-methyl-D-erythritol 4-phosphate cytidylyltransferase [Nitrospiria bacterium]
MGAETRKQFLSLCGRPLILHTLSVFECAKSIDGIVLVVPVEEEKLAVELVKEHRVKKVARIVVGGKTRQDSVYCGLLATDADADLVAVHDGVRPLVTEEIISRTISRAKELGAAIAAVPVSDTLKEASFDGCIKQTHDRMGFWLAQTPQVFRRGILMAAFEKAAAQNMVGTDEAFLVERLGYPVGLVEGSRENIKVTTPDDLQMAEYLLSKRNTRGRRIRK